MRKICLLLILVQFVNIVNAQQNESELSRRADAYYQNESLRGRNSDGGEMTAMFAGGLLLTAYALAAISQVGSSGKPEGRYVGQRSGLAGALGIGGEKDGQGTMYYNNGDQYSGSWKRDDKHGEGAYRYANGDYLEGVWIYDRLVRANFIVKSQRIFFSGYPSSSGVVGLIARLNGNMKPSNENYFGEASRDNFEANGYGLLYNRNGEVMYAGIWKQGKLIKSMKAKTVEKKVDKLQRKEERHIKRFF